MLIVGLYDLLSVPLTHPWTRGPWTHGTPSGYAHGGRWNRCPLKQKCPSDKYNIYLTTTKYRIFAWLLKFYQTSATLVEPTELIHDGGVDGVGAARLPVLAAGVEDDVALSGHDQLHRVRVVLEQVLVAMATLHPRPRYRVVAREVDADDVTSAYGNAVLGIESEIAGADPERHDNCLTNQPVPAANVTSHKTIRTAVVLNVWRKKRVLNVF